MAHPNHLMVDIETLDTQPSATVLSIGACTFDPHQPVQSGEHHDDVYNSTFYQVISAESNQAAGRTISAGTVMWWMSQEKDAQAKLFERPVTLVSALTDFRIWVQNLNPLPHWVWANSPSFDLTILRSAFSSVNAGRFPFGFWAERDVRTIKHLAWPNDEVPDYRIGTHHGALDDAKSQAKLVRMAHTELGLSR